MWAVEILDQDVVAVGLHMEEERELEGEEEYGWKLIRSN